LVRTSIASHRFGLLAETFAQDVEHKALGIADAGGNAARTAALPDPGVRRHVSRELEQHVPDLRKYLHVLMTVDEVRCAAEFVAEHPDLRRDLRLQRLAVELAQECAHEHRPDRGECLVDERRKSIGQRLERS
jgi:hypothetical protein